MQACSGGLLFGMDMGTIGGVLNMSTFQEYVRAFEQMDLVHHSNERLRDFGLKDKSSTELANLSSNIVSVIQAGAFAGALASMWLAAKVGRRWSLIITSWVVSVGVIMQTAAGGNIGVLYAGRYVCYGVTSIFS